MEFLASSFPNFVFFLIFYNTYHGVREVPRELIDSVRIMGGSRRDVATKVRLPCEVRAPRSPPTVLASEGASTSLSGRSGNAHE